MFHLNVVFLVTALSDVELEAQGDVDEGFDEEFEDKDINDAEPGPDTFQLSDLDPKELQQLLDDTQLPNLEDYDLGVDVLEQPHPILSPATITSYNFSSSPCSPYQSMVTTSPCPTTSTTTTPTPTEMDRSLYYNDYNISMENPSSVQSSHSSVTSASHASIVEELPLAMLQSEHDTFPDSTSEVLSLLSEGELATVDSVGTPEHSPPQTTVTTSCGLDLAETGNLLLDNLIELSTSLSAEASVDTRSMYMFGNGTGQLNLSPSLAGQTRIPGATNVVTLMDSTMIPPPSQERATISPHITAPAPPQRATSPYQNSNRHSKSLSPAPSPKSPAEQEMSSEDKQLVDMPYYQFRKILDDSSIPEKRKEEIKNIRRKGRNKIAAKVCRNKKMHLIMGLEKEVEQLRKAKLNIALKTKALEKEIAELKRKCHNR